jgi:thioredoxin reductase (NADPH)
MPGGQASTTDLIENYPGFPQGISGPDLMLNFQEQAIRFGLDMRYQEVKEAELEGKVKIISTSEGQYRTRTVIICSGANPRQLGVPGEESFIGRGVSYCATCDGALYQGRTIAVLGGGDAAVEEALFLTRFAKHVYIIHRRDKLRAARIAQERAFRHNKISFIFNTTVQEIIGGKSVEKVLLLNALNKEKQELPVEGLFVYIGVVPNSIFLGAKIKLTPQGYIDTNSRLETSVPGVFAAGDVRDKDLRQVATAVGDGAIAALSAERYLDSLE